MLTNEQKRLLTEAALAAANLKWVCSETPEYEGGTVVSWDSPAAQEVGVIYADDVQNLTRKRREQKFTLLAWECIDQGSYNQPPEWELTEIGVYSYFREAVTALIVREVKARIVGTFESY